MDFIIDGELDGKEMGTLSVQMNQDQAELEKDGQAGGLQLDHAMFIKDKYGSSVCIFGLFDEEPFSISRHGKNLTVAWRSVKADIQRLFCESPF